VKAHTVTRPGRLRWLAFRVWGSPLARDVDRAEAVLIVGLLLIWLLTLPLIATVASVEWTSVDSRLETDRATDIAVDAVLSGNASPSALTREAVGRSAARAAWTGRDGRPASGAIRVDAGAHAGDHVTVWLDASGTVVAQPMGSSTAVALTVLAAGGAWLALGLALAGTWWAIRRRLDRHRWNGWEQEWSSFAPGRNTS
jgi:hypothetical protein